MNLREVSDYLLEVLKEFPDGEAMARIDGLDDLDFEIIDDGDGKVLIFVEIPYPEEAEDMRMFS
jgi:hypothetical protein